MKTKTFSADQQLDSIQSMMESGHNSIRLEPHTLWIWGIGIGFLTLFTGDLFSHVYATEFWRGWWTEAVYLAVILGLIITVDYKLTRAARRRRDETVSLVQRRITFMIWLLFGFAFVMSMYASARLGGGKQTLGLGLMLAGIILQMIGLFSARWYRWMGWVVIVFGIVVLFTLLPGSTKRFVVTSVFAVGGPLIAVFAPWATTGRRCMLLSSAWIILVLAASMSIYWLHYTLDVRSDSLPVISLEQFRSQPESNDAFVIRLPVGTEIPLEITVGGDIFTEAVESELVLKTSREIDLEFRGSQMTGTYRIEDGRWLEKKDALHTQEFERENILTPQEGPRLQRKLILGTQRQFGGLLTR